MFFCFCYHYFGLLTSHAALAWPPREGGAGAAVLSAPLKGKGLWDPATELIINICFYSYLSLQDSTCHS